MHILEETDEFLFVQHAVGILDVKNERPDLEPGGMWINGIVRLTWGLRISTEPPTIQIGKDAGLLNGPGPLPRDLDARLGIWRAVWANRASNPQLNNLDFRQVVQITAILGWEPDQEDS